MNRRTAANPVLSPDMRQWLRPCSIFKLFSAYPSAISKVWQLHQTRYSKLRRQCLVYDGPDAARSASLLPILFPTVNEVCLVTPRNMQSSSPICPNMGLTDRFLFPPPPKRTSFHQAKPCSKHLFIARSCHSTKHFPHNPHQQCLLHRNMFEPT